jgi:hypothetical protein
MSIIFYYSNYCDNSKKLITIMSRELSQNQLSNIHFINIDKRIENNGNLYALLDNGQQFHIPRAIEKVPAIIVLNEGNNILFGNSIYQYFGLNLMLNSGNDRRQVMRSNDPEPFTFEGSASSSIGVSSDKYSFWDIPAEEMMAEGQGGLSQLHTYITLEDYDNGNLRIYAPEDNDESPKINMDINKLQEQRAKDVQMQGGPPLERTLPSYG